MRQHIIPLCVSIKNARAQIKKKKRVTVHSPPTPCPFPNAVCTGD